MVRTLSVIIVLCAMGMSSVQACLGTHQFKTFPVGVLNDQIITVDVQVIRTEAISIADKLDEEVSNEFAAGWVLYVYEASYSLKQELLSLQPYDTLYVYNESYLRKLQIAYTAVYHNIVAKYETLERLVPQSISFCDYQKECELVSLEYDSQKKKDFLRFQGKEHPFSIIRDTTFYGMPWSLKYAESAEGLYISSVRVLKTPKHTLLMVHLENGHEISMGMITTDPTQLKTDDGFMRHLCKEYVPDFEFDDITQAVYKEPLLHHGAGIDVFVVK